MSFCTSPRFTKMTLERLELHCLGILNNNVLIYKRYLDDCFLVAKKHSIDKVFRTFNEYSSLQLTIEHEVHNKISFLDIEIIRISHAPSITHWFRKATASGRYINFASYHPVSQKIAVAPFCNGLPPFCLAANQISGILQAVNSSSNPYSNVALVFLKVPF